MTNKKINKIKIMTPEEEKRFFKSARIKDSILNQDFKEMKRMATGAAS